MEDVADRFAEQRIVRVSKPALSRAKLPAIASWPVYLCSRHASRQLRRPLRIR